MYSLGVRFRFLFTDRTFFRPVVTVPYPINKKNIVFKTSFKSLFIKSHTKFHGDSVKNESARTKNYRGGAKRPTPQPVRVNEIKH